MAIDINALREQAIQRRAARDAEFEGLGYKRIGGKYVKVPTPEERALDGVQLQQAQLNLAQDQTGGLTEEELLPVADAATLQLPYGTTKKQAAAKQITPMTAAQRDKETALSPVNSIVDQIARYSEKVNNFGTGAGGEGRAFGGLTRWLGGVTQKDTNAAGLMRQQAYLSNIVRSLGEKGTLAEGDVQRAIGAIPSVWDTKDVAAQKIKDLRSIIGSSGQGQMAPQSGQGTSVPRFNTPEEAESANLPPGTIISINGRRAVVE